MFRNHKHQLMTTNDTRIQPTEAKLAFTLSSTVSKILYSSISDANKTTFCVSISSKSFQIWRKSNLGKK